MMMYLVVGLLGIPWFAGASGGIEAIISASGGYLLGFIFAALFLGYFVDRYVQSRKFLSMLGLMFFANFVLLYVPGLIQLNIWTHSATGITPGIWELLLMGVLPFVAGDILKIGGAAALTKLVTPKKA